MSSTKLEAAKLLIRDKEYDAARAILKTMPDDPTAIKSRVQLDQIAPLPPRPADPPAGQPTWMRILVIVAAVVVIGSVVALCALLINEQDAPKRNAAEYVCSLQYEHYSTSWQNCVDDMP